MNTPASRLWVLDGLKALAALLILLHHTASYGPLATAWDQVSPTLCGFLYDYGRMTVALG